MIIQGIMKVKVIEKKQIVDLIKRYFRSHYYGQAIKVKIRTRKEMQLKDTVLNQHDCLSSNYNLNVENLFFVTGYLEQNGYLHKFCKKLTLDDLMTIINNYVEDNEEVKKLQMYNSFKYSYFEKDKIECNFLGVIVNIDNKKDKTLIKS